MADCLRPKDYEQWLGGHPGSVKIRYNRHQCKFITMRIYATERTLCVSEVSPNSNLYYEILVDCKQRACSFCVLER